MFDRYTEAARRVLFFGRYHASKFGSRQIEPHHLVLGVVQVAAEGGAFSRFFPPGLFEELEREFADLRTGEHIATSVDLPVSSAGKRALALSAENAERRQSGSIDLVDVLAGLIQADTRVADTMARRDIDLRFCREKMTAASPEGQRARVDRMLDALPPDRLDAAVRIVDALGGAHVRIAVESDDETFTAEFR